MFSLGLVLIVGAQILIPGIAVADNVRDAQWHLSFLGMRDAQLASRGEGVAVAVIDSGVDASHPDLGNAIGTGLEVNSAGDGRSDQDGHGTSMAGLVAARGRTPSDGALGIASGSVVIPVKIPNQRPLTVAAAIDEAMTRGVKIICLALTTSDDRALEMAVRRAQEADIVVVAGAGNYPDVGVQVPAKYPGVLVVVGIDRNGNHAAISVSGPEAMLAAPAIDVVSTAPGGGYSKITGTSPATAIIAGVAALVRSKFPDLNATEVIHRMTATAIDKGDPGRDKEYGFGIVNPVAALTADVPPNRASLSSAPTPSEKAKSSPPSNNTTGPVIGFAILVAGLVIVVGAVILLGRRANNR
ncbi:S8 family serine peptidase [Virgisporangium aurantiacum]|nr:S8 family serine peptidase [Virgisporangium aurantiacum]